MSNTEDHFKEHFEEYFENHDTDNEVLSIQNTIISLPKKKLLKFINILLMELTKGDIANIV
ncbi:10157_t:CDS:1, partial [Diversispora eburnea]